MYICHFIEPPVRPSIRNVCFVGNPLHVKKKFINHILTITIILKGDNEFCWVIKGLTCSTKLVANLYTTHI